MLQGAKYLGVLMLCMEYSDILDFIRQAANNLKVRKYDYFICMHYKTMIMKMKITQATKVDAFFF